MLELITFNYAILFYSYRDIVVAIFGKKTIILDFKE